MIEKKNGVSSVMYEFNSSADFLYSVKEQIYENINIQGIKHLIYFMLTSVFNGAGC
jgi:hypothetical protein